MKYEEIILSTWFLIKEDWYDYKLKKTRIDNKYLKVIKEAYEVFDDYNTIQKNNYIILNDFIF